ncbi:hypothetical protein CC1G_10197 [Coprinopsis cinerea okayama7|uniref:Uncharacterized protein n=1 Tax=Coprinopsis cinerea (strain Okayama-7 / 130 / ATCC MYA-4618 / FGSC 9003) TaxID=240176 RepID=A8PGE8_COPC7|nr:hypothetical protein CC1G_10197 [Coprinopsis cinerea okayama7\|eukprot:XP_001841200.2 hypothetical protein CC1G_10197 [Coprinopsis cinerea okayama7\
MTLLGRYVFLGTWEVTTQPTPPGCFSSLPEGQLIMIAYVLVLYSGFMTMILCLYYGFRMYWTERETGRLIKIFYRDGAIYFVILSAMSIANAVAALFLPSRYRFLLAPPQAVAHSTLSIRMILHLREGARKQMGFGTNEPRATMTWEWSGTTTSQPFMATPYRPRA